MSSTYFEISAARCSPPQRANGEFTVVRLIIAINRSAQRGLTFKRPVAPGQRECVAGTLRHAVPSVRTVPTGRASAECDGTTERACYIGGLVRLCLRPDAHILVH